MAFSQGMVDNFKEAFALFDKQGHGTFVVFGLPRALNGLHSLPCPQLRTCTKARDFVDLGLHLAQDFPTFLSRCLPACHFSEVCYRVQCVLLPKHRYRWPPLTPLLPDQVLSPLRISAAS